MTTRRDEEALKRLADAITRAHPDRVARIAADLAAEIEITETQARDMAEAGETANALTATSIAASITRIHRLLAGQGNEDPAEGRKPDRASAPMRSPVGSAAEGDSERTDQ